MKERGVEIDQATVQRWVVKYTPILKVAFRKRRKAVGTSWRMDKTYIKVKGKWSYLYRAVNKEGKTIHFLLTKNRDKLAAKRFLSKAILKRIPACFAFAGLSYSKVTSRNTMPKDFSTSS